MKYPFQELIDRLSIEKLKEDRIPGYKSEFKTDALIYLTEEMSEVDSTHLMSYFKDLYEWNGKIWDLESAIRQGKEGELGLEEVGRRAIAIRELNNKRIEVKNRITEKFGGYTEVKHNHASE